MWSIPHRVVARRLNSYTLETLGGLPLAGLYNSRRLRIFEPREGTKLAMDEMTRTETHKMEEMEQEGGVASGGAVEEQMVV